MADNALPSTPPPLQALPTAKERKYDRQLRLWGATGQIALEESHILLINNGTGATGIETLKNLVLPGAGQFTIHDSHIVQEADLGVNFFLEETSVGKFRATETAKFLEELNPDVKGHAISEPIESWISAPNNLIPYTLILVAAPIKADVLSIIQKDAASRHVPLFYFHSTGFYSHFSLQLPHAFPIVDTHPDPTATQDLRVLKPWSELEEYAKRMTDNFAEKNDHQKGHIPYVCLLLHFVENWKTGNGGKLPESYKEKSAIRNLIQETGGNEENFQEAYNAVLKSLNAPAVPSATKEILSAPETQNLAAESASFWFIANGISTFVAKHGVLPLPGAVPDMKAESHQFIKLQKIYKEKARRDCAEVTEYVNAAAKSAGRNQAIDSKEIENFCKGAAHVHLIRGRELQVVEAGKLAQFKDRAKALANRLSHADSLILIYLAFLAFDEFSASHEVPTTATPETTTAVRVPGSIEHELEADEEKLSGIASKLFDSLLNEAGTTIDDPEYTNLKESLSNICVEITRAGGVELHNIASLTGGMIAQEVVKVITAQYVPIDNTCLFDGIESKASVLKI